MKKSLFLLLCLILGIVSCSKDKEEPKPIELTPTIVLSENSPVKLVEGQSKEIQVSGENLKAFTVTSSNAEVVTVSAKEKMFVLEAKLAGTATITVTSKNVSKDLIVEVSPKNVLVQRIEFNEQNKFPVGRNATLNFTIFPENATNKKLKWESNNPNVVRVDENGGIFVLNKPGQQATIKASATDGSNVSAEITIIAFNIVNELNIRIGEEKAMAVGSEFVLQYDAYGINRNVPPTDSSVSWKSDAPEVVSVDANGRITCHKEGRAQITATANDGFGAQAQILIKSIVPINKIKINGQSNNGAISLKKGTSLPLVITTFEEDKLVETINGGKSQSQYVTIHFSKRTESTTYLAQISREGLLQANYKTGTFILRVSYENSLISNESVDCEVTVTITE
ncbi:Ig-like domain-containing protein [Capnocytophaga felis]|uniref:BIG2 domain-containing protein n=1 Tax=Capnocytophaga felis TaxID=2267611 RepID=A0A5M4B9U3_9FLAO|nr:Ig-like domain-containing protein [Capnocytophaga felis]GET45967.1 hypothetical protein RCZ01_12690 [Capnocytophaga felis]GET49181.1 hypothetical protein RCZ02_20120 [Capnocytophaga felis]